MNEFLIQLQAILDKETSKGNINKSIERIQNQINKLKIQAEIDPNSILAIKKQLEQLTKQPITLGNINIGQSQIDKAGKEIGKGISDSVQRGFNDSRINTDKLNADIKTLKNNLNTFASKNAGFETFKTEINGAEVSLESLIGKLSSVNNVTDLSTLRSQANALKTSFTELAQVNKIQMQLDTGGYESKVETLVSRTMQWTDGNGNAKISTDALRQSLEKLNAASAAYADNKSEETQRRLIEADKELDKQIKTITNSVQKMNAELAKDTAVSSLHNKIQTFYDNNSASHGRWGAQLKQMLSETASGAELTTQRVREIEQSFNRVATAARQAGKVGKSWFQSLKEGAKLFSAWTSPTMLIMRGISEVKKGINAVKELDTALVDLKKTTTMTSGQLEEFYYDSNNTAKQMGVITKEIIDQAGAWSRLGFNTAETATQMAKYSSQFASISPGMSVDNATTSLVSIMKAYDIDVDNVLDGILSKINDIGNKFGTSNAEIAEGLSKSSAAMAAVGGSIEDNIALFTAGQEIVQDASTVGNAIRSIALRIRGYDEETEQLSDDLVDVTGKVADLTKAASNGGHGISLFTDASQTEYKSLVSYLGEISDIWDELDQKSQNELLDKLFGKNRAQVGAAIIKNFDAVRDSIEVMGNSAGSADREMSVIMDGLDYKLNRLKETGTGIAQNLFERDEMKSVVDGFTSFLEIIDSLTSKIGLLGTIGAGAGLFAGFKNTGIFKAVQSTDDSGVENTRIATSSQARRMAQDELNASLARQAAQLEADTAALQTYEAECAHGTVTTERFAAVMNGASSEAQAYAVQTKGAAGSAQAFTARQKQVQAELEATAKASKAATIAGKALSIALNMIAFAAIAKGISFVAEKLSDLANASKTAEEKASSFAESLNSSMENIAGNRSTLEKLNDEYQKLAKGVNDLGINTGLSAEQYDRYKEIMAQVSDIMPDLTARFNAQGEAIAFTKGKLEDLNKEYEKSIQKNAKKLLTEGNEDGETPQDVIDNFNSNSRMGAWENFVNGMKNMFGSYDIDDLPADTMLSTFRKMQNKTRDEISDFLNDVETDGTGQYIYTESNRAKSIAQHVLDETAASIRQMDDEAFNQLQLDIAANIESLENSIDTDMEKVKSVLLESMNSKDTFWALDEGQRENVSTLLSSLTADAWKDVWDGNEDISPSDMYAFVERIISAVRSNEGGFADAWMDLFSIDEDIPVNEYVEKVRSFMNAICDVLKIEGEENRIQWMLSLGFDIETDEASIIGLKEKLSNLNGGAKNQDAAKWVDTLTKEELEFAHSDEFINALEEQKKQLGSASLKAQDYETALDKMKSAQKNFDKDSKITSLTDFIGKLDEDAIKNYNDKISSLKSYLDKLKSGDFSNADKSSLADDFGITGDSVDELTEKIQELMDTEMDSIINQIDEILNSENLDEATRKAVENLKQSLIGTNKEAQNLNSTLFKLSDNPLENIQSLSQGLDQLDKIYADILDKEDFDWSSILNNDGFKEAFSAYTEEYENFINTVAESPNDINACQDAFNKLASAYLYGTGVLDGVTEATKAGTIAMLEQMGVANAAAIVEQALIENEKMLAAQKYAAAKGCRDLAEATYEEIQALIKEGDASEETRKCLERLALEKWNVQKIEINTKSDIDNIIAMANAAGASADQIARLKTAMSSLSVLDTGISDTFTKDPGIEFTGDGGYSEFFEFASKNNPDIKNGAAYKKQAADAAMRTQESVMNEVRDLMKDIQDSAFEKLDPKDFYPEVKYTGGTTTRDTRERLAEEKEKAEKEAEETAEQFDWLETKLDNLSDAAAKAKDKISDLLSFGSKKKQTQKAIEATTKALEAEYKAMKRYAEYAERFSLDAAKETTETVTESVSGAVSDAVSNAVSSTVGVVNDAMQYVDKLPYVWGGESLTNGADCSGFVRQLYKAYGINLDRTAQAQYGQNIGVKVRKEELQPGDLVFFNGYKGAGGVGHVGIYMGDGKFIHEPGSGQTAKVSYLSDRKDFVGGKRFGNINNNPSAPAPSSDTSTAETYTKTVPGIPQKTLEKYWKLVREGSFDVETITNEKLKKAIKSYQEWYEKMKSCRDKIEELNNTLKELYQTMADIPIDRRDKNVETLDTRLDILNSKRDNISAVIVDKEKYKETSKNLSQSRKAVRKGMHTKAQKNASGLTAEELKTIQKQMKAGQTIPAKILDKIEDGSFYETCKKYNDAVYERSRYSKTMRTAAQSIKKYNTISDQILDAEKAKTKQYKTAYNATSKSYGRSLTKVTNKGKKASKAVSGKSGLDKKTINKINSYIKKRKEIPEDLMAELIDTPAYADCTAYNEAVTDRDAFKENLDSARFDLQKQQQAETAAGLQVKTEKHQYAADRKQAKIDRNNARMENTSDPAEKNKYLRQNASLLDDYYKHMIEIAKLENDSVEAARLKAEWEKAITDNKAEQHQNIADHAQAKIDRNNALAENTVSADEKNKYAKENLELLDKQYGHLLDIAELHKDHVEYARLEAELQSEILETYKSMFDNVKTDFENRISLISNGMSDLDNEIKKIEASGRLVDASYYDYKISMENENLEKLKEEETELAEQLKNIKMFSPAWYECQDAIQGVQDAQAESLSQIKSYKDAINEIADTIQNDILDAYHNITDEAGLLITLLGDNLTDADTGGITENGLAALSLYVSQMNVCGDAAESTRKQVLLMKKALENGELSFVDENGVRREYESVYELNKALDEMQKLHMDEIQHEYGYGTKIVDLMKQKYQSELDYLKELIEQKQKLLDAEKDLYEYSKNIKSQTDNINSLRKQIAALRGDTSKETEARIQKLQSQLRDSEESLKDQEYDRYISDQKDILNNLYSEYEKLVNDVMNDRDRLLKEGLDLFAQTGSDVQDVIKDAAEEHGYEMTEEMEKIISSIEGMGSLDSYLGVGGTVTQSLDGIAAEIRNAYTSLSSDFRSISGSLNSTGHEGDYPTSTGSPSSGSTSGDSTSTGSTGTQPSDTGALQDAAKRTVIGRLLRNGTNAGEPKSSLNKYIYNKYGSALTEGEMARLAKLLGLDYSESDLAADSPKHQKYKKKILEALQLQGFSKGGIVQDLDNALRGNRDSVIISANPGESVFTEKQTGMIRDYVNKAPDYKTVMGLESYMDKMVKMPDVQSRPQETNVRVEYDNVNINLPNVMNYADFMNHAKKDHDFEKMINCIVKSQMGMGRRLDKLSVNFRN